MQKIVALRNLKLMNLLAFLFGFRLFDGVAVIYIATVAGSFTASMSYYAIMHVSAAVFEIPTGLISDRLGRKNTIVSFYCIGMLSIMVIFFAEQFWHIAIAGVLSGLTIALRSGAATAFMYENVELIADASHFKKYEGRRRAFNRYAATIAGFLGSAVIYLYGIETAIAITIIALVACAFLSFFLVDVHVRNTEGNSVYEDLSQAWKGFIHNKTLRQLSFGRLLARAIGNAEYRFRALFFSVLMPPWLIELLGALNNLLSAFFMQTTHWIVEKIGYMRALVYIDLFDRAMVTVLVLSRTVWGAFGMSTVTSVSFGVREIAAEQLLQEKFTKDQRATMGSIVGMGGSIVYGVVAVLAGFLADQIGVFQTMLYFQPLLLIPTYFFYKGIKNNGKQGTSVKST